MKFKDNDMITTQQASPFKTADLLLSLLIRASAIPFIFFVFTQLFDFPIFKTEIIAAIIIYAVALSIWSKLWMVVLPALLPVLDFTPWSGRILITEFDLFILITIAVSLLFKRINFSFLKNTGGIKWILLLFIISYTISTIMGYFYLKEAHTTSFYLYLTEYNSLRVAKGFFTALFFLPILAYEKDRGTAIAKILSIGILTGLTFAIASIVWERLIFPGFFDFSNTYRISGLFSGMLLGGTIIDAYLALAFPFFIILFYSFSAPWLRLAGVIIFAGGLYSLLVTFSHANFLVVTSTITVLFLWGWYIRHKTTEKKTKPVFSYTLIIIIMAFIITAGVLKGGYIVHQISAKLSTFDHRIEHWLNTVEIKNDGFSSFLLGRGKGSYPNIYFNSDPNGLTMGRFWLMSERNNNKLSHFIRLSPSDKKGTMNVIQRIPIAQAGNYQVRMTLRNHAEKQQKLLVEFCNKNILKFKKTCIWRGFKINPQNNNEWQVITQSFSSKKFKKNLLSAVTPVDINLLNRGLNVKLDISRIEIISPDGQQIIRNSQFNSGFDHWYFSSANPLAWHIENLWVSAFFEGGVIELILISLILFWLIKNLFKQFLSGNPYAAVLLAAVISMMIIGLFVSIFDEPRISWLFFLLTWLVILKPEKEIITKGKKKNWFITLLPFVILASLTLTAALYTIKKLNYTIEDVTTTFISKVQKKLNIEASQKYRAKLDFPASIYQWRGQGANPVYNKITTKYDRLGKPLAISENSLPTLLTQIIKVNNSKQFLQALKKAKPGDAIELQTGIYSFKRKIKIGKNASTTKPIIIYAKELGNVLIELNTREGFKLNASNWTFQNLIIKGVCASHKKCEHAFHIIGKADGTILRNNIIIDFNAAIKGNGNPQKNGSIIFPDNVLIEKNSFTNTSPRNTRNPVTTIDVVGGNNWRIKANFISDFIKLHGNKVSYAGFLKGYGSNGIFEENLIMCNMNFYKPGHTQVGLSFGGGGTTRKFCWDKKCDYEHVQGTLRNNIIMNCNDVGIYINSSKDINIINNTLYNTAGIDIRFPKSNAIVINNLLNGRIRNRNKAESIQQNNLLLEPKQFKNWFSNPDQADFSPLNTHSEALASVEKQTPNDYCSQKIKTKQRIIGATITDLDQHCQQLLNKTLKPLIIKFDEEQNKIIKNHKKEQARKKKEEKLKKEVTLCKTACKYQDLNKALTAVKTNGTVIIEPGKYNTCGVIKRSVKIIGKTAHNKRAHLIHKACDGKAALIITAPNVSIENLQISKIRVKDKNGACLRLSNSASKISIKNVYCHDSQAGIKGKSAELFITDSIFERNGYGNGSSHNISLYAKDKITITNSRILSTKGLGHTLQINAPEMLIDNSIIAALNGKNSRAINNTIGGRLTITNSVIQQGKNSDNDEMIAYALGSEKSLLEHQFVYLENNLLIFDRVTIIPLFGPKNKIFRSQYEPSIRLKNNTIIGMDKLGAENIRMEGNKIYNDRQDAQLPAYDGSLKSLLILDTRY